MSATYVFLCRMMRHINKKYYICKILYSSVDWG